jgi:hypothetical protein
MQKQGAVWLSAEEKKVGSRKIEESDRKGDALEGEAGFL